MALNQGYSFRHTVVPEGSGATVVRYLVEHFSHSTEAQWRTRIEAGEVTLNDQPAREDDLLRAGDQLVWNRPGWVEEETPQSFGQVFLDEHLLVVDKPSGLPTIPGAGFYLNTLLTLVQREYPEARPLHRLGRATSGLVLFARSQVAASRLSRDWPQIRKQYQALADGRATDANYDIQVPIGPLAHPRLGTVHAASPTGKPARSIARVVELREVSTLFEVDLLTGRPHQIRTHLAAIGHPLVGDPLYAVGGQPRADQPGLPGDAGYWLHAKQLVFQHPITNDRIELTAPLPEILRPA